MPSTSLCPPHDHLIWLFEVLHVPLQCLGTAFGGNHAGVLSQCSSCDSWNHVPPPLHGHTRTNLNSHAQMADSLICTYVCVRQARSRIPAYSSTGVGNFAPLQTYAHNSSIIRPTNDRRRTPIAYSPQESSRPHRPPSQPRMHHASHTPPITSSASARPQHHIPSAEAP